MAGENREKFIKVEGMGSIPEGLAKKMGLLKSTEKPPQKDSTYVEVAGYGRIPEDLARRMGLLRVASEPAKTTPNNVNVPDADRVPRKVADSTAQEQITSTRATKNGKAVDASTSPSAKKETAQPKKKEPIVTTTNSPEPAQNPDLYDPPAALATLSTTLSKEAAIRYLQDTKAYYKLTPRERSEVCRVAEVEGAKTAEVPIKYTLGDMKDIYETVVAQFAQQNQELALKSPKELKTNDERIAYIYQILINSIYQQNFTWKDQESLQVCLTAIQGTNDYDVHAAASQWVKSIFWFFDFWRKDFTGVKGMQVNPEAMIGGAQVKMTNDDLNLLWMDPDIERATHEASTRSFDELAYESKAIRQIGYQKTVEDVNWNGIIASIRAAKSGASDDEVRGMAAARYMEDLGRMENRVKVGMVIGLQDTPDAIKWKARATHDVAIDILGEMLDKATYKVRKDPAQANKFIYSAYKSDHIGRQLSEIKYDFKAFEREIAVDPNGHAYLIWNNGMETLFTFPNSKEEIRLWVHKLIEWREALDAVDPAKAGGLMRNMAWLISYAQGVDDRIIEFEALDFEKWVSLDSTTQRDQLRKYVDKFFTDYNQDKVGASRCERTIARNISRARTTWVSGESLREAGKEPTYNYFPWLNGLVPNLEVGIDLDAVWFNPKTNHWEYVINFRDFYRRDKGSFIGDAEDLSSVTLKDIHTDPQTGNLTLPGVIISESGRDSGNDISNMATYEGYKQHAYKLMILLLKAKAFKSYGDREGNLDALQDEETWKHTYAIPEYGQSITNHLIERAIREEKTAALFKDRYSGLKQEFLGLVMTDRLWLDWELNHELHYKAANVEGSWIEAQMTNEVTPGKKIRQAMMELAQVDIWKHFAKKHGIDLDTLLLFAGVKMDGEENGDYKLGGVTGQPHTNRYLILDYLNKRKITSLVDGQQIIEVLDQLNDKPNSGQWGELLLQRLASNPNLIDPLINLGKTISRGEGGKWAEDLAVLAAEKGNQTLADQLRVRNRALDPEQDANWTFLTPFQIQRLAQRLNWEYEEDEEMVDGKPNNWFDSGAGTKMVDLDKCRTRVNMRQRRTVIPLGDKRGQFLYPQWFDEQGRWISATKGVDLFETMKEGYEINPFRPQNIPDTETTRYRNYRGEGFIRGLIAGWWEFQPETGLMETGPWYDERSIVYQTGAIFTAPFRLKLMRIKAEIEYKQHLANRGVIPNDEDSIKAYKLTEKDKKSKEYRQIYDQQKTEQMAAAGGPDFWQAVLRLSRIIPSPERPGKGFIDEKPALTYARVFGCLDDNKVNQYRSYELHRLAISPKGITPDPNTPDQLKEAKEHLTARNSQPIEQLKKVIMAPEVLELPAMVGVKLEDLSQLGDTTVDDGRQWGYGLTLAALPPAVAYAAVVLAPVIAANAGLAVTAGVTGAIINFAVGMRLGTDVPKGSLVKEPISKLPLLSAIKLSDSTIYKLQQRFPSFWAIEPISKRRELESEKGKGHAHYLNPEGIVGLWADTQKAFGPAEIKGGRG